MTCGKSESMRELFGAAFYDELEPAARREFDAHLDTCASCRAAFDEVRDTLALMSRRTRVEPTEAEWESFRNRLEARLEAERSAPGAEQSTHGAVHSAPETRTEAATVRRRAARPIAWLPAVRPAWAYGIAAALLIAFGIYMGRTFFTGRGDADLSSQESAHLTTGQPDGAATGPATANPATTNSEISSTVPETASPAPGASTETGRAAERDALAYLERSRNLLLGVTNLDAEQAAATDLSRPQKISRELYDQGNTLTVALNEPSQQQLRQLVQQLQVILLQLANMQVGGGTPAVELVRQGVDSRSILLKINLEAIRAALNDEARATAEKQNL